MAKIFIIEDDSELSDTLKDCLKAEKHVVEQAFTGKEGLDQLRFYNFDLIVLDWDLPEMTGLQVCSEFRCRGGNTPILFLTGMRDISFKEAGFEAGGDDYLTKPFNMREFQARVKALLRRPPSVVKQGMLKARDITIDLTLTKVLKNGEEVKLNAKEFALLEFLMKHPGQVFSAEALLDRVWKSTSDATSEAVTSVVKRLRKKLDSDGQPSLIKTMHGIGYKLDVTP